MAREFPIANGKLVTDLDANGFKILNAQGDGGDGGGTTDYNGLDNKPKINGVEVSGRKSAEDYGLATKEQLSAVNKTATDAFGIADLARGDIGKVYNLAYQNSEQIKNKRDRTDNIAAADEVCRVSRNWVCSPSSVVYDGKERELSVKWISENHEDSDSTGWAICFDGEPRYGYSVFKNREATTLTWQGAYDWIGDETITATASGELLVEFSTKSGEPYVTPTGVKNIALPKYEFVDSAIADGKVTVASYTNAKLISDGTAFTVAVAEGDGKTRDCVLRVECGDTAPKITWGANFHPRTDAETDFACEAGKRNIYWLTEHAPNEFVVAGWQETEGGNAE